LLPGLRATFANACSVLLARFSPGTSVSSNNRLHLVSSRAQPASMFASELKVARVGVCRPFGGALRTSPSRPVSGSARLRAIIAAFCGPGASPRIRQPEMNCWASAKPAATVVRSLTRTLDWSRPVLSTVASRTAGRRLVPGTPLTT
jgi:hypothetical protein